MTALSFDVLDVAPQEFAAAPHLLFRMRVSETSGATVHAIALRCQLRIEPQRRPYDPAEQEGAGRSVRHLGPLRQHPEAFPVDACDGDGAGLRRCP